MPIAEDASTPAVLQQAAGTTGTAITASFSPPAGSVAVVLVTWMFSTGVTSTLTCADSNSVAYAGFSAVNDVAGSTSTGIFTHYYATAPGAVTVKVTCSSAATAAVQVAVRVLTGAASVQTGAGAASTSAAGTVSVTTTTAGSWVMLAAANASNTTTVTANAATTGVSLTGAGTGTGLFTDVTSGDNGIAGRAGAATVTPGATTLGWTANADEISALEILPAAAAALAYRTAPVSNAAGSSVTKQAGTAAGDLIILMVVDVTEASSTLGCSGFASQVAVTSGDTVAVLTRTADGSEGSSFVLTTSGSTADLRSVIITISGGAVVGPASAFDSATATTSIPVPSITVAAANSWAIWMCRTGAASPTTPSGFTSRLSTGSYLVADNQTVATGATGTVTSTCSSSGVQGAMIAVSPAIVSPFTVAQQGHVASATVTTGATTAGNTLIALAVANVSTATSATCTDGTSTWPLTPAVHSGGHNGDWTGVLVLPNIPAGITSINVPGAYSVAFLEVAGLGSAPTVAGTGTAGSATNGTSFSVGNPSASAADFTVFNVAYDGSSGGTAYADGTGNQVAASYYGQYSYTTGTGGSAGSFPSETYDACAVSFGAGYAGTATLAGAGTVTPPAFTLGVHATLAGAGTVAALGVVAGTATLAASSIVAGAPSAGAYTTLAGVSSLTASSAVTAPATLAGAGAVTSHGTVAGITTLAAGGGLAAACSVAGSATLPAAGTVTGMGVHPGAATLAGASTTAAAGTVAGAAALAGAGTVVAFAGSQSATLTAAGTVSAAALAPGGATLTAATYLSATVTVGGDAEMDGATGLGAQPLILYSAVLAGAGGITPNLAIGGTAILAGDSDIDPGVILNGTAALAAATAITAAGVIPGTAALGAWPPLTYTAGITAPVMNPFTAPGPDPGGSEGGTLTATGVITGTAALGGAGGLSAAQSTGATAELDGATTLAAAQGNAGTALLAAATALTVSPSTGASAPLTADSELEAIAVNQTLYDMSFY